MRGILNGSTFETPDGERYYKLKADAKETKLYFRCKNYTKGCKVILHTNYTDRDNNDLKVIFKTGDHNHRFDQDSSECGVGRGRKRRYARAEADEDSELEEEDEEGESGDGETDDGESGEDEEEESGEEDEETVEAES